MKCVIQNYHSISNALINKNYSSFIINSIIVPHGVTDISHSLETNNFKKLLTINTISYFCTSILSKSDFEIITDLIFFYFSIIHFKNDFSLLKKKKYLSSIFILLLFCINNISSSISLDIFFAYMSVIHVPFHYKKNWFHIKKKKILNIFFILCTAFISNTLYKELLLTYNPRTINILKSIIISHIIYNEG